MARSYVQLWEWFNGFGDQAVRSGDDDRARLYRINGNAHSQQEKYPEQSLRLYREGALLAEQLNEPWMVLFYEYWVVETLLFGLARYEEGLDLATKLVTKSAQELYRDCPVRARVYITLITAYGILDGLSYIDEVRAMIHTMETQMALDEDTHLRLIAHRAHIWILLEDTARATEDTMLYLEMSDAPFRQTDGYELLCYIHYLQGQDQKALEYAQIAEEKAASSDRRSKVASSCWWQALLLHLRSETEEAARRFWLGIGEARALERPKEVYLWGGVCRYYEATGAYDKALAFWDEQVALMDPRTPNRQSYFTIFLRRCFLLRRLGRLTEGDIEQTRQAALRMRKPEKYLALMEELHDGKTEIPRY